MTIPQILIDNAGSFLGASVSNIDDSTAPFSTRPVVRLLLDDRRTAILKTGSGEPMPGNDFRWMDLLDREIFMYDHVPFGQLAPERYGVVEGGNWKGLLLADLGNDHGVSPWTDTSIDGVAASLAHLHALAAPANLPFDLHLRTELQPYFERIAGRKRAAGDLPADLSTAVWWDWFETVTPALDDAYADLFRDVPRGFVHNNVRSDNLFVQANRGVFIDWDHAIWGSPACDSVYWALGIEREAGVPAQQAHARYLAHASIDPGTRGVQAVLSFWIGYFVEHLQAAKSAKVNQTLRIEYLRPTLAWAVEALHLPTMPV